MKIKLPKPWTAVRENYKILCSSLTQSGIFCSVLSLEDTTVINDMPLCFWKYEMVEIETKFELFDKIRHTKIKERQGEITNITYFGDTVTYYCSWDEINEKYAEIIEEKKVWFAT